MNGRRTGLVTVAFNPVAVGEFTNSVEVASNGEPQTIPSTGSSAMLPIAGFSATPTNGAAPLPGKLHRCFQRHRDDRLWTFGDGSTSTLTSPNYSYTNAGTFSVSLTVFGPLGSNTLFWRIPLP